MNADLRRVSAALEELADAMPEGAQFSQDWHGGLLTLWFQSDQQAAADAALVALGHGAARIHNTSDRHASTVRGTCHGVEVRLIVLASPFGAAWKTEKEKAA